MREGRFYKFWVYIIASRTGTLYTGMSGFVDTRIAQHKSGEMDGFTKKYKCDRLVYHEQYDERICGKATRAAIERLAQREEDCSH